MGHILVLYHKNNKMYNYLKNIFGGPMYNRIFTVYNISTPRGQQYKD
jgi:hypothetical protein